MSHSRAVAACMIVASVLAASVAANDTERCENPLSRSTFGFCPSVAIDAFKWTSSETALDGVRLARSSIARGRLVSSAVSPNRKLADSVALLRRCDCDRQSVATNFKRIRKLNMRKIICISNVQASSGLNPHLERHFGWAVYANLTTSHCFAA